MPHEAASSFQRFLDVMLPEGGCAVALAEVYIDESYDDQGPPILCVAGYVYRKRKAIEFSRGWANYLRRKGLPYFHMAEAAHTKSGIFKDRPDLAREVETELIARTRASTEIGLATTINEDDYAELMQPREGMRSAYAAALLMLMSQVRRWADRTRFSGKIAYFFEAGHKHQQDANAFMAWLFESERIASKFHYGGHAFLPKATPALQPADLLAWQWRLEAKRQLDPARSRPVRADLIALVRDQDRHLDWSREDCERIGADMLAAELNREALVEEAMRTGVMPPVRGF